ESLQNSMRYGPAPIGRKQYRHVQKILALLESQLGHIEVTCSEPGARVTLDGRLLFVAPGKASRFVRTGEHQIIASKRGRETYQASVKLNPGDRRRFSPVLPALDRVRTERYMPAWAPWASLVGAVATVGGAIYMDRRAERAMERFDIDFNGNPRCSARGCYDDEEREQADQFERAERQRNVAAGMYVVGSAALVGSAVLLYINRERIISRPERTHPNAANDVAILPMTRAGYPAGIQARIRF
ncbi:MAG: PEGA domain-containing protein, partial [Proteobacteria bacterium]|nr:PEGA domain-containing protein [Pseudomonadota bacterium]